MYIYNSVETIKIKANTIINSKVLLLVFFKRILLRFFLINI